MMIGVLFFVVSLAGAGFVIFYQNSLLSTQKSYQDTLAKNENQFNPTLIATLQRVNTKIDVSKQLIANHSAVSEIFGIIGALTAQNIQFNSLEYSAPVASTPGSAVGATADNLAQISMQGVGTSFSAIAFQSDVFGQSSEYGRNIVIKDPILSDLSLDANGNVEFTFTAGIDPADISYEKILDESLNATSTDASNQ
jgi:hypothetical protein